MNRVTWSALSIFIGATIAGTLTDMPRRTTPVFPGVAVGDFHVHAMPGDGFLPVWEVQREANRRGLDAIAITNHNHQLALRIGRRLGLLSDYPIVIPGQEVTARTFHMAAVGINATIDSELGARAALDAIHVQGGVGIAAHPFAKAWRDTDVDALRRLDGSEVGHPAIALRPEWARELREFYERARAVNPDLAAIGSSDFHGGRIGAYCTHVTVHAPTQEAVLQAIREGRTAAYSPGQSVCPADQYGVHTVLAFVALLSLAIVVGRS
jgi:predicted metal-dependent phosphoesterase TrpH